MSHFIDYAFYRIAKFYHKWDGSNAITAKIAVSGAQLMYIILLISVILRWNYSRHELSPYAKEIATISTLAFIIAIYINSNKYKNSYSTLRRRWQDETIAQSFIGCLAVWVIMSFPVAGMLLLAIF